MRTWRGFTAAALGGLLAVLPAGLVPSRATSVPAASSLDASASLLPSGRLHVSLRTSAARVTVAYVVLGRSTRSMSVPVRRGRARVTLPLSATSVRVRAAVAWQRLAIPPRWPQDVAPSVEAVAEMEQQLLALVNEARAAGVTCPGGRLMPPAPPLTRSTAMDQAARGQSAWQARTGIMSHTGARGSTVGERITASGHPWSRVAEVVSTGYALPADTLGQWLASPGHCTALMDPGLTQTGIGYAYSETSTYRHFWTQDLAAA